MNFKKLELILLLTAVFLICFACSKTDTLKDNESQNQLTPSVDTKETDISPTVPGDTIEMSSIQNTMSGDTFPKVDGSTATIPLTTSLYCYTTGASTEEAQAKVFHTKTTNSYLSLISGEIDLVIAYEPSDLVYETLASTSVKLNIKPIGRDALVFLANENNPVTSLTQKELIDIYSGNINNWSQVGGLDLDILAFQRPKDSGSQTLMEKLVMKDVPVMEAPTTMMPTTMDDIIEYLASYNNESNALGYSVYYYTQNMYQLPGLRYMSIDGIKPETETISDASYPYINEFYAVIRENEPNDTNAHKIFDWLTTSEGQDLISQLGYVSLQ